MLKLVLPARELLDTASNTFINTKEQTIQVEHSLVSLQKWEAKWRKPFLADKDKSWDEMVDYIRCMTLTQNVDPSCYLAVDKSIMQKVYSYIEDPMTATTFSKRNDSGPNREIITAEVIYSRMIEFGIPFECRKWHLNQLLTLIRVCAVHSQPPKKMSNREIWEQNRALNAARKKKHHTRG